MLCVQVVLKHTHTQVFAQSLNHNKSSQATRIICFICGYTCKLHSFGHVLHVSLHTFHRKSYMHCSELLLEQAACPIAYEHILQSFSLVVLVVAASLSRCHHLLVRINAHIYIYTRNKLVLLGKKSGCKYSLMYTYTSMHCHIIFHIYVYVYIHRCKLL